MSDHERGAYTPPTADAPLSFDPRQPVRGARPIPLTLVLSVLVLAALVGAIFLFYQSGVRHAGEAPQTVGKPVEAIKSAAPPEAQPQDPAAGLQVYRSEAGGPVDTVPPPPTFTKGPEAPQARPTTPVVVTQAPPVQAKPAAPAPAVHPVIPAAAPLPPEAKAAAAILAPKPAPPAEKAPPAKPKPVKAEAAAKPEPKKIEVPPAKPPAAGGAVVQIGAVSSTALADKAWSDAVAVAPGLAAGKGKGVEKIEKNGGTLYRTAVTGFASKADAQAFCAKLQAAGKSCFVR
ncbi:SPOR domain-containing protein [Phenylobacterium sp.]|uniref:cell division protein FtsN n=1 Tax=Phenylobacterium sp. TaxID=1871053 RepID=UPI0025D28F36|nr:SPOR domain-containing protein [Phenylobacterium sp.]